MNKSEIVQSLLARMKRPASGLDELVLIYEDYKAAVSEFAAAGPEYRRVLGRANEEYPDLDRLIGRKYDAVLKGRLLDAILLLKKKVEAVEAILAPDIQQESEAINETGDIPTEEVRRRNMPTLGMD